MTRTEERLADALAAAAYTIREDTLRPLAASRPRRHWPRAVLVPAAAAASMIAAASLAVILTANPGPAARPNSGQHGPGRIVAAAWAVRVNGDRTVTITVGQLRDPDGLQRALRREGIPALVRYTPMVTENVGGAEVSGPACDYVIPPQELVPPAATRAVLARPQPLASPVSRSALSQNSTPLMVFTVRPWALPAGAVIFIQDSTTTSGPGASSIGVSVLASDHLPPCVPFHDAQRRS
ncbi:MAG TPA: hypothetical protein VII22_00485 [Streptosporangiaceae bacterium]